MGTLIYNNVASLPIVTNLNPVQLHMQFPATLIIHIIITLHSRNTAHVWLILAEIASGI